LSLKGNYFVNVPQITLLLVVWWYSALNRFHTIHKSRFNLL